MDLRYQIPCFFPVADPSEILTNYFFPSGESSSSNWYKQKNSFSIPFIEFLNVQYLLSTDQQQQTLLNRIFFSSISDARAKVSAVEIINNKIILTMNFFTSIFFQKNENISSLQLPNETSSISIKVLERYFKKPETLILATLEKQELEKLKKNPNFEVIQFTKKQFPHNNFIVIIKNKFTKQSRTLFFQESNDTNVV